MARLVLGITVSVAFAASGVYGLFEGARASARQATPAWPGAASSTTSWSPPELQAVTGQVEIREWDGAWHPLASDGRNFIPGMTPHSVVSIRARDERAAAVLKLRSGVFRVGPHGNVGLGPDWRGLSATLRSGQITVEAPASAMVYVPAAALILRGTRFGVWADEHGVRVAAAGGTLTVQTPSGKNRYAAPRVVVVEKGEETSYPLQDPLELRPTGNADWAETMNGALVFGLYRDGRIRPRPVDVATGRLRLGYAEDWVAVDPLGRVARVGRPSPSLASYQSSGFGFHPDDVWSPKNAAPAAPPKVPTPVAPPKPVAIPSTPPAPPAPAPVSSAPAAPPKATAAAPKDAPDGDMRSPSEQAILDNPELLLEGAAPKPAAPESPEGPGSMLDERLEKEEAAAPGQPIPEQELFAPPEADEADGSDPAPEDEETDTATGAEGAP